jgi:hypothetical protein
LTTEVEGPSALKPCKNHVDVFQFRVGTLWASMLERRLRSIESVAGGMTTAMGRHLSVFKFSNRSTYGIASVQDIQRTKILLQPTMPI